MTTYNTLPTVRQIVVIEMMKSLVASAPKVLTDKAIKAMVLKANKLADALDV